MSSATADENVKNAAAVVTKMMRAMRPRVPAELEAYADRLRDHGAKSDLMESRRAFAEKRAPDFQGR